MIVAVQWMLDSPAVLVVVRVFFVSILYFIVRCIVLEIIILCGCDAPMYDARTVRLWVNAFPLDWFAGSVCVFIAQHTIWFEFKIRIHHLWLNDLTMRYGCDRKRDSRLSRVLSYDVQFLYTTHNRCATCQNQQCRSCITTGVSAYMTSQ